MVKSITLKLTDVLPNPYRDFELNPLREDKLEELESSIHDTGFWKNVIVRRNADGKYEVAYGHHRIEAAKRAGVKEHDFIVEKLSDDEMLAIMSRENRDSYNSDIFSVIESVQATVKALAEGKIKAFKIDPKVNKQFIRYAPSYIPGKESATPDVAHAYTVALIAEKLGYARTGTRKEGGTFVLANPSVEAAIGALELVERGVVKSLRSYVDENSVRTLIDANKRVKELHVERITSAQRAAKEAEEKLAQKQREADAKRREQEAEAKKRRDEMLAASIKAREEENDKKVKEIKEKIKRDEANEQARAAKHAEERKLLDEKIAKRREEQKAAEEAAKGLPYRHLANTLVQLNKRFSETSKETVERAKRNVDKFTVNERELIRQAFNDLSEWARTQSNFFLPTGEFVRPKPIKRGAKK